MTAVQGVAMKVSKKPKDYFNSCMNLINDTNIGASNSDDGEIFADKQLLIAANSAMASKLSEAREKGRKGWWNNDVCTISELYTMRNQALSNKDHVSVLNFTAMIAMRESQQKYLREPNKQYVYQKEAIISVIGEVVKRHGTSSLLWGNTSASELTSLVDNLCAKHGDLLEAPRLANEIHNLETSKMVGGANKCLGEVLRLLKPYRIQTIDHKTTKTKEIRE